MPIFFSDLSIHDICLQISHAIKRYVRLGFDITSGEDIEKAIENLSGTLVANINPNRAQRASVKIGTIPGNSDLYEWHWPTEGSLAGYICARPLPGFGDWKNWSPIQLRKWKSSEIEQPQPCISEHSTPQKNWTMPIYRLLSKNYINIIGR